MKNIAIIGLGVWGQQLLRVFRQQRGGSVAVVCDSNEERLATVQKHIADIDTYSDPADVFKRDDIEAVAIAVAPQDQPEMTRSAIEAGKDVFVEIPPALSVEVMERLTTAATEADVILMTGFIMLFHPAVQHLRKQLSDGYLGSIHYIQAARAGLGRSRQTDNVLWSYTPNDVAFAIDLIGKDPVRVTATGAAFMEPGHADVVFVTLHFGDGTLAHLYSSWLAPHRERRVVLVGSRQTAVFDDIPATEKVRVYGKVSTKRSDYRDFGEYLAMQSGDVFIPRLSPTEPLAAECAHFIECVEKREQPITNGELAIRVIRVLEAAQKSLEAGGAPVTIQ